MANLNIFAGLDISKSCFDISIMAEGIITGSAQFGNDQKGFIELLKMLPSATHCVMEATGPYYLRLASWLHNNGFVVSVLNPLVIRRFSQMQLRRVKTDKADAGLIAEYASRYQPRAWTPPAEYLVKLQQLDAMKEQVIKELTALTNQLEAFSATGMLDKDNKKLLNKMIAQHEKNLQELHTLTDQIIEQHYRDMLKNITSIPGIARKTATTLITITDGFTRFKNHKQLCAYIGITPRVYESGSSIKGKARICKLGMSRMRALLYVCAWSAKRYNKACKELYERLVARGKAKKLALIAVANKLLRQAYAIATQNKPYLIQSL